MDYTTIINDIYSSTQKHDDIEELKSLKDKYESDFNENNTVLKQLGNKVSSFNKKYSKLYSVAITFYNIGVPISVLSSMLLFIFGRNLAFNKALKLAICYISPLFVSLAISIFLKIKTHIYDVTYKKYIEQFNLCRLQYIAISYLSSRLLKIMYKDIYEQIYKVQDWLSKNDSAGYSSFVNACDRVHLDFSKYIEDYNPQTFVDLSIDNYYT